MAESGGPVVGSVEVEVKARLDRFERDLEQVRRLSQNMQRDVQGGFDGIRGAIDRMSAPLMRFRMLWGAATAALGALQVLNAVRAFARLEQQQIAYNAVLRATGFGAGRTARDIENLADSLSRTTAATQSEVRQAATTLLTFRTIAGETFDEVLRLSQDLAAAGFGSLATNARLLGRALEDPAQGLTILRRAGIVFSEAEQAVIKDMIETGRRAEAVDVVLQKLRSSVGGAGAAQAGTLTGAFSQLVDASGSLLELWGRELAGGFQLTGMYQRLTASVLGYL
ncbi:MAG: phage tail length tape measure family protein, partial [Dehalococcoidia bacterium]|nr:phage tail length tape measure family protein [Dehalococcoidia bacterium]